MLPVDASWIQIRGYAIRNPVLWTLVFLVKAVATVPDGSSPLTDCDATVDNHSVQSHGRWQYPRGLRIANRIEDILNFFQAPRGNFQVLLELLPNTSPLRFDT